MSISSSDSDPLRVEFQLTESDYIQYRRYFSFHQLRARPIFQVLLAIIVLIALVVTAWTSNDNVWFYALLILGAPIGAYAALLFLESLQSKHAFRKTLKNPSTTCVSISPEGVTMTTDTDSADLSWRSITAIDQNATLVLLLTSSTAGIYIPKSAFSSQEHCATFVQTATHMQKSGDRQVHAPAARSDDALASVVFQPTLDDTAHVYSIIYGRTAAGRRARLITITLFPVIVFLIVAGAGINQIVRDHNFTTLHIGLITALVVAAILPILAHPKTAARHRHKHHGMNQAINVTISKTGFIYTMVHANITLSWSNVSDIILESDGLIVLITSGIVAYGIPPSAFLSIQDAQKFHRLVTQLWKGKEAPASTNDFQSTESVWPPSPSHIVE